MNELETIDKEIETQVPNAVQIENSRAMQEIQAAVISAKKFPRDTIASHRRIIESCKRKNLAEQAMYAYPRGGQQVTGPSIRLAEVLAQNWGNLSCGITELEQGEKESVMMAFCVDLETNYRKAVVFNVRNERHTKKGVYRLTDPRDIYENNFNLGARRLRACILAVIPGDVIDDALNECDKTLAGKSDEPLVDRAKKMLTAFESIGVSKDQLEVYLGKKIEAILVPELVKMQKVYKSITDGMSKPGDWFDVKEASSEKVNEMNEKYSAKKEEVKS